jgi:hypothetical protein
MDRIDYKLAEILNGEHQIEGTHEERVVYIEELIILYTATIDAGWARHTGDWDWAAFVTMSDGEVIEEVMTLNFADRPEHLTATVQHDKVTHLELYGVDYGADEVNGKEYNRHVAINQVTMIRWEQR